MEPTSRQARKKTRHKVDQRKLARALKLIDKGRTWDEAVEATGVSYSSIGRARAKLQKDMPLPPEPPATLDWEVWQRAIEPERTPGTKQFMRKFYLIERCATRADAYRRVAVALSHGLYTPADMHIANEAVGYPRPGHRAPKQAPRLPRMPWAEPRATPEAVELKQRLKAATFKPPKPLRTMVVEGKVVEIPLRVTRAEDLGMKGQVYSARWTWRKQGAIRKRKTFTDSKYGGALGALEACKKFLSEEKK